MKSVVLVHGFMGGGTQWTELSASLEDQFKVVTIDLPGFGANNAQQAPKTMRGFAEYVLNEVTGKGIASFHLLGHSMGGMIVQEMMALAPEKIDRLVLYGTGASGVLPERFETIAESKRRARQDGPRATARRISATWFFDREEAPGYVGCAAIAEQSTPQAIDAGLDAMESWSRVENLSRISVPTLVVWGDQDRTYAWAQTEQLWRTIPQARLSVIPHCAHAVHLEKPWLFNAVVRDFLE